MAIQLAADAAPNGRLHCMNPPARKLPDVAQPAVTLARPPVPCELPSNTVRKQRTWRASAVATAAPALITAPSCDGSSRPPEYQLRLSRRASCTSTTPAPEKPGG